jgi:hypothetical protein
VSGDITLSSDIDPAAEAYTHCITFRFKVRGDAELSLTLTEDGTIEKEGSSDPYAVVEAMSFLTNGLLEIIEGCEDEALTKAMEAIYPENEYIIKQQRIVVID